MGILIANNDLLERIILHIQTQINSHMLLDQVIQQLLINHQEGRRKANVIFRQIYFPLTN